MSTVNVHIVNGGRYPVSFTFFPEGIGGVVIDPARPELVRVAIRAKPPRVLDDSNNKGVVYDRPVQVLAAGLGEIAGFTVILAKFLD